MSEHHNSLDDHIAAIGRAARTASRAMSAAETARKNQVLETLAIMIEQHRQDLTRANDKDLLRAREAGFDAAFIDRLTLSSRSVDTMIAGLHQVAGLADPVGEIDGLRRQPSGISVGRMRVPLGVIGIIYESRPNVTIDAAALCIKAGNAAVLRGGSEAIESNGMLARLIAEALASAGLPGEAVQLIPTTDRAAVSAMIKMPEYIDVIVPRGGKSLIERVARESRVPVIKHLDGICHVFIDRDADLAKAVRIADNAKTQRYGTCNTMETLLLDAPIAAAVLTELVPIYRTKGVEMRICARTREALARASCESKDIRDASEEDWHTEYLAPIIAIRTVDGLDEAMAHISHFGSRHTDAIVSENYSRSMRFLREVDSASVMINASTRFADGFEYGLGAEIGISNDKLHARGPVGLEGLTTYKWVVLGQGEIRN